ncbi:MAG: glucose 1-dehydrogenase [Candidatus Hydrogenedentota bacterium]|nr:MAG: glucose 1-dehydrogenase [Candidatus Hydrogenedentota bacterium]
MRLKDSVAIVTGGGGGLGEGISVCLSREGAHVVVSDLSLELAEKVAAEVKKTGQKSLAIQTDVSKADQCEKLVQTTVDEMGKVDILVCSAGVSGVTHREHDPDAPLTLESVTEDDWNLTMDVNLKGVFLCNRAVATHFREQNSGKIINISSVGGRKGSPLLFAYSISKAAVIALTQAVAQQLAPFSVNVNAICPGIIYTPMWEAGAKLLVKLHPMLKGSGLSPEEAANLMVQNQIAFKRMQTPEDIGNAAVFLASEEAKEITGQALNVCGGMHFS